MPEYIIKENTGSAFKSNSENPKAPKFSGKGNIDGVIKQIDVWENEDKNGNTYLKFDFKKPWVKEAKPKEEVKEEEKSKYVSQEKLDEEGFDDVVPF